MEGGFAGNTEDDKDPAMATGLNRKVPMPDANDNYVNASVILPRGNSYTSGKVKGRKKMQTGMPFGGQLMTQ